MTDIMKFENSRNIAIVRTDKIGDMVLTLPLVKAIKSIFPDKKVTVIARSYCKPIVMGTVYVDNCLFVDEYKGGLSEIFKKENFDTAFFPRPVLREALLAYQAGIKLRVGSAYRFYSFLFNHKVRDHRKVSHYHEAEYNVRMLESLTGLTYITDLIKPKINEISLKSMEKLLDRFEDNIKVIIHPGSGGSAKDLPIETLIEGLLEIGENDKYLFVITGIESEKLMCDALYAKLPNSLNLCGKLNLEEMIALIELSDGMIANSTGVLHIAASLKKRIIGFYPNSAHISHKRWGPYGTESIIINPPFDENNMLSDDMNKISSHRITEAIINLFGKD